MKILTTVQQECAARYRLNEYTAAFGSIIFDESKGGNISDTYFLRYNKTVRKQVHDSENVTCTTGSFIDFYIGKRSKCLQHIDFVALAHFDLSVDESLAFRCTEPFFNPVIDVSTWVSEYGGLSAFSYDHTKYLITALQINVKIIHNGKDTVKFVFGDAQSSMCLNANIEVELDAFNNLSSIMISDENEVSKLIKALAPKGAK